MSHSIRSASEKEQFWRRVLEEHVVSNLSVRAFCQRESLSEPSFYSWRRKLHSRDLPPAVPTLPTGLIPVEVLEEQRAEGHAIEIVVHGNIRLRIQAHCSSVTMSRALSAVRETYSC